MKVFTEYGLPDIIHLDQERNFESSILRQTLEAFGVAKSRTTAYHSQGDGMIDNLIVLCCRCYVPMFRIRLTGSATFRWSFMHIAQRSTPPQGYLLLSSCMVAPLRNHPFRPAMPDPSSYQSQLQAKLAKLCAFVETHLTEAAHRQRNSVGHKTQT